MPVKKTVSFLEQFKEDLKASPFPTQTVGFNKLSRSLISKEDGERVSFYLDASSALTASIEAMKLGITTDELFRRLVWSFVSLSS